MLEAYFTPGEQATQRIIELINNSKKSIKICVFTISDNAIVEALKQRHKQGIEIRIITDNQKVNDLGNDIKFLASLGIPVKTDNQPSHMHHKFAIFDDKILLTGSYNWTVSAKKENYENILILNNKKIVRKFADEFEKLWRQFYYFKNK